MADAIESVYKFVPALPEVIVVDNASVDNTVAELQPKFPEVKFISNNYNAGFSAANNQGFKESTGKYLLFLNPDAKLVNNNHEKALTLLENNSGLLVGPKILNPDRTLQDSVIQIPDCVSIIGEALFLSYFFKKNIGSILAKNNFALSGACLLMQRTLYEKLNGFDEDLFWMDDVDLCYRAKKKGAKLLYFADWTVVHTIGVSSKKNYRTVIANQLISKLKFFKKNNRTVDFVVSAIFIQLHIFLRLILFLVLSSFSKQFREKFSAYLYAQAAFCRYIFTKENKVF